MRIAPTASPPASAGTMKSWKLPQGFSQNNSCEVTPMVRTSYLMA